MSALPTTAARTAALAAQERRPCSVLELTLNKCSLTYGVAPCTATGAVGSECYNTRTTCQATAAYTQTTVIRRYVSRGVMAPASEALRPYLLDSINAPTALDFEAGLAARNSVSVTLADETDNDSDQDPYFATRAVAPQGTYWQRWLARNLHYFGRTAKLRRGFVASPWDWTLFLDELYIIDSIATDGNGQVKITLKDPLKLTDNKTIPLPTSGAISADLKAIENTGNAQAGGASTITLASAASALDSYYNGMEVYITANTGAGQRRVVQSYVGATRVATLTAAWSVVPDTTSTYQVSALSITFAAGKGAQYADPATSGKAEYIRINSEIIRYTAKSTDTLSWTDSSYRAQFYTNRADHANGDTAQLCRAFVNQTMSYTITALLIEGGITAGYISPDIVNESTIWYGSTFNTTACISAPEKASDLLAELMKQIGAVMWWSPQVQKVEMKAIMPSAETYPTWNDESTIMQGSMSVKNLETLRITEYAVRYAQKDATSNLTEPRNFQRTEVVVEANAESANEYGDVRPKVVTSRWFSTANQSAMLAVANRQVNRLHDAPKLLTFKIDPKDYTLPIGSLVVVETHKNVDFTGAAKSEVCMLTQSNDASTHVEVQARTLNFATLRYGFIAPNGTADYPTDTVYAHIAQNTGKMTNGDNPYLII